MLRFLGRVLLIGMAALAIANPWPAVAIFLILLSFVWFLASILGNAIVWDFLLGFFGGLGLRASGFGRRSRSRKAPRESRFRRPPRGYDPNPFDDEIPYLSPGESGENRREP